MPGRERGGKDTKLGPSTSAHESVKQDVLPCMLLSCKHLSFLQLDAVKAECVSSRAAFEAETGKLHTRLDDASAEVGGNQACGNMHCLQPGQ